MLLPGEGAVLSPKLSCPGVTEPESTHAWNGVGVGGTEPESAHGILPPLFRHENFVHHRT